MSRTIAPVLGATLALLAPAAARAIPPGGPVENRQGATLTVPDVVTPAQLITVQGQGFDAGEVVNVKVDDGLLLPKDDGDPATQPDVFKRITASTGETPGRFSFQLDPAQAQQPWTGGKHNVRALTATRSVHADFAVSAVLPREIAAMSAAATAFVGPAADQPGPLGSPFVDIPQLVAGSEVPFRTTGYTANGAGMLVSVLVDDGAITRPASDPRPPADRRVWGQTTATADGSASGTIPSPTEVAGTHWLRVQGNGGISRYTPFAVVPADGRGVQVDTPLLPPGNTVRFSGRGLLRPQDYRLSTRGQTVEVRLDGSAPQRFDAGTDGAITGGIKLPADIAAGTHKLQFWVGFKAENDAPQLVTTKEFTVDPAAPSVDPGPPVGLPPVTAPEPTPTPTPPSVVPVPPIAPPVLRPSIASTKLTLTKGRVNVVVRAGAKRAKGRVSLTTVRKLRAAKGKKAAKLTLVSAAYDVAAGKSKTLRLRLTKTGARVLRQQRTLKVVVRLTGTPALTRTLTLKVAT